MHNLPLIGFHKGNFVQVLVYKSEKNLDFVWIHTFSIKST